MGAGVGFLRDLIVCFCSFKHPMKVVVWALLLGTAVPRVSSLTEVLFGFWGPVLRIKFQF